MQELILFLLTFGLLFTIYELFIVSNAKKNLKKKKDNKQPIEVKYLIYKYKFDLGKIKYNGLLHVCAFVTSFDVSMIVSLAMIFDSTLWQMITIGILIFPVILISYHVVYLIYKKKGLI